MKVTTGLKIGTLVDSSSFIKTNEFFPMQRKGFSNSFVIIAT